MCVDKIMRQNFLKNFKVKNVSNGYLMYSLAIAIYLPPGRKGVNRYGLALVLHNLKKIYTGGIGQSWSNCLGGKTTIWARAA